MLSLLPAIAFSLMRSIPIIFTCTMLLRFSTNRLKTKNYLGSVTQKTVWSRLFQCVKYPHLALFLGGFEQKCSQFYTSSILILEALHSLFSLPETINTTIFVKVGHLIIATHTLQKNTSIPGLLEFYNFSIPQSAHGVHNL